MTPVFRCRRCGHSLTIAETLENWCQICRAVPQAVPPTPRVPSEPGPGRAAPESAVRG